MSNLHHLVLQTSATDRISYLPIIGTLIMRASQRPSALLIMQDAFLASVLRQAYLGSRDLDIALIYCRAISSDEYDGSNPASP